MHCPFCRHTDTRVVDSREPTTAPRSAAAASARSAAAASPRSRPRSLTVVKRSGATEPFSRDKVVAGVRKACQGRPVTEDDLALLAQRVEETVRASRRRRDRRPRGRPGDPRAAARARRGRLPALRLVYRAFDSLEDFEAEIALLRAEREPQRRRARPPAVADQRLAEHRPARRSTAGRSGTHRQRLSTTPA